MLVSMQDNPTKPVKVKLDRFASTISAAILRRFSDNLAGHFAKICAVAP
jgi:hypothetical protein